MLLALAIESAASAMFALILVMLPTLPQIPCFVAMRISASRILSRICRDSAIFAPYGLLYIHLGPAVDRSRPRNHASPAWVPRSHPDQGESEAVHSDSDMGGNCAPDSDSSLVGRLSRCAGSPIGHF